MTHEPECDVAWKWPDFMGGRGIDGSDCWMCDLIRSVREDERAACIAAIQRRYAMTAPFSGLLGAIGLADAIVAIEELGGAS